jgi:hypothetical protein
MCPVQTVTHVSGRSDDSVDLTRLSYLNSTKNPFVLDGTQLDGRFNRLILLD